MSEAAAVCVNHPQRETGLRCNRCGDPICASCAVRTEVGYRCPQCVRNQQKLFDTTLRRDYIIGTAVAAVGAAIGIGILTFLGIFGLLLAPVLGGGLAEVIRWAIGRRRSRRLPLVASIGAGIGAVPHLLLPLFGILAGLSSGAGLEQMPGILLSALWPLLQAGLTISALYYRLKGIRLG